MPWEGDEALNEGLVTHASFYKTVPFGWVVGRMPFVIGGRMKNVLLAAV